MEREPACINQYFLIFNFLSGLLGISYEILPHVVSGSPHRSLNYGRFSFNGHSGYFVFLTRSVGGDTAETISRSRWAQDPMSKRREAGGGMQTMKQDWIAWCHSTLNELVSAGGDWRFQSRKKARFGDCCSMKRENLRTEKK